MNPDSLFQLTSIIAALGWIAIIVCSPFWPSYEKFTIGIIITLLALIYSHLNFSNFHVGDLKGFSTLDGVSILFQNKSILLAGWVHIMAFDLFVAVWIKKNSVKHGIAHWWILIPLIFTCMLGPLGFLFYIITRSFTTRSYFAGN